MNTLPEVTAYIARSPEDQQELLQRLRAMIRERLPQTTEAFVRGMPVYTAGSTWRCAFASRKKGVVFYAIDEALLDGFAEELGTLRTGKGCVEMKVTKKRTLVDVLGIVDRILGAIAAKGAAGPSTKS